MTIEDADVEVIDGSDGSCGICVHQYLFPMYVVKVGPLTNKLSANTSKYFKIHCGDIHVFCVFHSLDIQCFLFC